MKWSPLNELVYNRMSPTRLSLIREEDLIWWIRRRRSSGIEEIDDDSHESKEAEREEGWRREENDYRSMDGRKGKEERRLTRKGCVWVGERTEWWFTEEDWIRKKREEQRKTRSLELSCYQWREWIIRDCLDGRRKGLSLLPLPLFLPSITTPSLSILITLQWRNGLGVSLTMLG